jgi:hypothetical protein
LECSPSAPITTSNRRGVDRSKRDLRSALVLVDLDDRVVEDELDGVRHRSVQDPDEVPAEDYELTRPWMAARLTGSNDEVEEATARSVGSLPVALQAGLAAQWLLDPEHAPTAREVTGGLVTICVLFRGQATGRRR